MRTRGNPDYSERIKRIESRAPSPDGADRPKLGQESRERTWKRSSAAYGLKDSAKRPVKLDALVLRRMPYPGSLSLGYSRAHGDLR